MKIPTNRTIFLQALLIGVALRVFTALTKSWSGEKQFAESFFSWYSVVSILGFAVLLGGFNYLVARHRRNKTSRHLAD